MLKMNKRVETEWEKKQTHRAQNIEEHYREMDVWPDALRLMCSKNHSLYLFAFDIRFEFFLCRQFCWHTNLLVYGDSSGFGVGVSRLILSSRYWKWSECRRIWREKKTQQPVALSCAFNICRISKPHRNFDLCISPLGFFFRRCHRSVPDVPVQRFWRWHFRFTVCTVWHFFAYTTTKLHWHTRPPDQKRNGHNEHERKRLSLSFSKHKSNWKGRKWQRKNGAIACFFFLSFQFIETFPYEFLKSCRRCGRSPAQ